VIDKEGTIGEALSLRLSKESLVIFVSQKKMEKESENIFHVPFFRKFPEIPDSKYSHVVFIDKEGEDLRLLSKIIKKVKDVNADLIFAQGLISEEEYAVGKVLGAYPNAKIVLFGDVFSNKLIFKDRSKSTVNRLIYEAQKFGKMQVLGDGLRSVYPVFLEDVVGGLVELVLGEHELDSLFYAFPKDPPSELSLAHMIQKANPEVTVDFVASDLKKTNINYPSGGKSLLGDRYTLAKKIRDFNMEDKINIRKDLSKKGENRFEILWLFISWTLIFLLISPVIFTAFFILFGLNTFYYAREEVNRGNFVNAKTSFHLSQTFFYLGKQASNVLSFQAKVIGQEDNAKKLSEDINLGYVISDGFWQALNFETHFAKVLSGESKDPAGDFAKGENYLKGSIVALDKVKAEGKIPALFSQNLQITNPLIKLLSGTVDVIPVVLGMKEEKTYLILFQNNMELRPGGGAIDAYGILKFNMGKIKEFIVHDIYEADQQLRGHIEPPFAIRRYLSSEHWYMKDSNFDINFIKAASSSSNFLMVETGQKTDGVVAVDAAFLKGILHAIGPVYVDEYRKNINENNFYELLLASTKEQPLTSSAQRKSLLGPIVRAVAIKAMEKKESYLSVAQVIFDALIQKHLLFAFKGDLQNMFTVNGWSSSLWDERKNSESTLNDFLEVNEANLGLNSVNYFIRRQIIQKITISNLGNVSEEVEINYKNESAFWPGGEYKNYLRIVLPKNVSLSEVWINDVSQDVVNAIVDPLIYEAKNFKPPQGLEIEKTSQDEKTIFGFLVKVPPGKITKIKLKYNLSENINKLNVFSYNLKLFKQPGVDNIPYSFSLVYPSSFAVVKNSEGMIRENDKIMFAGKIIEDKNLIIDFAKK
jgi:hypothetical protein